MEKNIVDKTSLATAMAGLLLSAGLGAGPLAGGTSASAASPAEPLAATQGIETLTCSTLNFRGEIEFTPTFGGISGDGVATIDRLGMKVQRYRITRLNGQSGGDKASLSTSFSVKKKSLPRMSADNLRQDGQWHAPDRLIEATISGEKLHENGDYLARVTFTFDRSGPDPECTSTRTLKINPVMTGKSQQTTTRYDDLWGSCRNQDVVEQACTISRAITRQNIYTANLSVSHTWLTANISKQWATTYMYTNGWNPKVPPGKTASVYGAGTETTFTVAWTIGTATSPPKSGRAFEYNGSVLEVGP